MTTVTNNSPQAINTSLFSLEKMINELDKKTNSSTGKGLTKISNINLDNLTQNGIYYSLGEDNLTNKPVDSMHNNIIEVVSQGNELVVQTFTYLVGNEIYVRNKLNNGSWTDWVVVSNNATSVVISVNGKQGVVNLDASDVGALPDTTVIPAAQVNSDWNATSGVSQILNKPTIPSKTSQLTNDSGFVSGSALLDFCYPVGSLYWSSKSTNPSTLFGGTWVQIKDRFVWAKGDSDTVNATGGEKTHTLTKSEMPSHTHSFTPSGSVSSSFSGNRNKTEGMDGNSTGELRVNYTGGFGNLEVLQSGTPFTGNLSKSTVVNDNYAQAAGGTSNKCLDTIKVDVSHAHYYTPSGSVSSSFSGTAGTTGSNGSGTAHNNMPPYVVKYCWERTA